MYRPVKILIAIAVLLCVYVFGYSVGNRGHEDALSAMHDHCLAELSVRDDVERHRDLCRALAEIAKGNLETD